VEVCSKREMKYHMSRFIRICNREIFILFITFILFFSVLNISTIVRADSKTPPSMSYFDARPHAQLQDGSVTITCIATDNIDIKTVEVTITYPDKSKEEKSMTMSSDGKYVYSKTYDDLGKYIFRITVKDKAGNEVVTDDKTFWITLDKDDTDNDGMPDWWEEKYGLNPEDPTDATEDTDGDSYTNSKEYEIGTNPAKDIFLQNAAYQVKENGGFLAASMIIFIIITLLSIYGKRRRLR
jgi:hypothetical protein